ncbi:uncharacterized protein RBU33_001830 [Hipposideros larvatus]
MRSGPSSHSPWDPMEDIAQFEQDGAPGRGLRLRKASNQPSGHSQDTESSGSTPKSCPELSEEDDDSDLVPGEPFWADPSAGWEGQRSPFPRWPGLKAGRARQGCASEKRAPEGGGTGGRGLAGQSMSAGRHRANVALATERRRAEGELLWDWMECLPICDVIARPLPARLLRVELGSRPGSLRRLLRCVDPATTVLRAALALPLPLRGQLTVTNSTNLISKQGQGSHSLMTQCVTGEYWTGRHCCKDCPAGEYVHEPCRSPHTQGKCMKCDRGTFTAFPNGLDSCFPCATCSQDQEVVVECTLTSDRLCQCITGHFYQLPDSYEFCRRCSTCPQGHVVLHKCNSTADTVCGVPDPEHRSRSRLSLLGAICLLVVGMGIAFFCYMCHRPCKGNGDRRESTLPESSVSLTPLNRDQDGDSSVPVTENGSLSEDSLDVVSEVPSFTRTPESLAGVDGTQAAAGEGGRAPDRSPQPDPRSSSWACGSG